jgi:Protein of unknown function (DUF1360)
MGMSARPQTGEPLDAGTGLESKGPFQGYARESGPLGEYGLLIATFVSLFSLVTAAARRQGRLPERVGAGDVVLLGVATHKLSRLVTKDKVTSVVRAPFTRRQGSGGPAEVEEEPRGRGARYAVGELLTCPYCLGQWVAAGFALGLLFAPRVTRLVAGMLSMVALSDFLQIAYKAAESRMSPDD